MIARFWWGQCDQERRVHWINWQKLCNSEFEIDMSFRDLETFNLALLTKQGWRLLHNYDSLFYKVLKAKYFLNSYFLFLTVGSNPFFVWSICDAKSILETGCILMIEQGNQIHICG